MNLIGIVAVFSSYLMGEGMTATYYYHCTKGAQRHYQTNKLTIRYFFFGWWKKDAESI